MPDSTDRALVRRHRRLLLAYPRWHRRLHGADLLTTLLDEAAAGRRPGRLSLVLDGLRARFRVRGAGGFAVAVLLSLFGAVTLAAVAGWCGWRAAAAPWPTVERATALAGPVLPPGEPASVSRRDDAFGPWLSDADSVLLTVLGSPELRPGGVYLSYVEPRTADRAAANAAAAERLRAAGWQPTVDNGRLLAGRDGLRLIRSYAEREPGTEDVVVSVSPAPPPVAYRLAWLGAGVGALLGWLAAAAALARSRRQPTVRRWGAVALAVVGVALSVPSGLLNAVALVIADADARGAPPWAGYEFVLARPAAVFGAVLVAAAWLLTTPVRPAVARERAPLAG